MNFLWINNFLKLGDTICFQRRKKSQVPDPEQEIFFFALPQISWILYFVSAYALENQFSPQHFPRGLCTCRDDFSTQEAEFDYFRPKVLVIFILFLRQVRENKKDLFFLKSDLLTCPNWIIIIRRLFTNWIMLENAAKSCHEFNRTFTPNMIALIPFLIIFSEISKRDFVWPLCLKEY